MDRREKPAMNNNVNDEMNAFMKSLDEMEKVEDQQLVEGTVVQVNPDYVFVNIGFKSEGKIAVSEFNGKIPAVNEKVNVFIEQKEGRSGEAVLSKLKAEAIQYKTVIKDAFQNNKPVFGKFIKSVTNGLEVELGNGAIKGFCPISKADVEKIETGDKLVGVESGFKILKFDRNKLIVSRRDFLKEEIDASREKFFETVHEGDVVNGIVKSFTSFGAFIDLGGFDGLLHINDMSWGHVSRPKEYVKKGQKIELIVLALDHGEKKINLSLKHFTPDPWLSFSETYKVDDIVKGKVTKMIDYGAFVEIKEGIEGFVHISELSWVKRVKHPKEILSEGEDIEAKILEFDIDSQRISLGLKQVFTNPWDTITDRYQVGQVVTGPVVKITNSGAFVKLEDGIDGFVHVDDLSWTKKVKSPSLILKAGEEATFAVVAIIPEERRIRLGMKQLSSDPWENLSVKYRKYSEIDGVITSKTDFGLFVKVDGEIEGLINIHQLPEDDEKLAVPEILAKYNVGDPIKCAVLEISALRKRLSLSVKALVYSQQQQEISKYIHEDNDDEPTATMADFFK